MATAAKLDRVESASTDIVAIVAQNHSVALLDREKFSAFYDRLKADVPTDADITTNKGRDAIRSYAARVRTEKAAINKDRLRLTKEWRDLTDQVNSAGKEIDGQLEALAVEVRAPLTAWEDAEKARVARCDAVIATMRELAIVSIDDTSDAVRERGSTVFATVLDPDEFGDRSAEAESVKLTAIETLKVALARLVKEEADRAELERLRSQQAEREAKEAVEQAEKDRNEARRKYARQVISYIKNEVGKGTIGGKVYPYIILIRELEEKIIPTEEEFGDMAGDVDQARREILAHLLDAQKEQAERSRREAEEQAANAAREEEARKAQADRDRIQREHDAALKAERNRADEAERARQADADRIAAEEIRRARVEADAKAERDRVAAEEAKRQRNRDHRSLIQREVKEALMSCGADEETAKKIVLAIVAGNVPHTTVAF